MCSEMKNVLAFLAADFIKTTNDGTLPDHIFRLNDILVNYSSSSDSHVRQAIGVAENGAPCGNRWSVDGTALLANRTR